MSPLSHYLRDLEHLRAQAESTPELSLREPLLVLIREYGAASAVSNLIIAPEASGQSAGQPDIYVKRGPRLVGFVETKAPGTDLNHLLRSDKQIKRYRESFPNWVLTDYYQFLFLREGDVSAHGSTADQTSLSSGFESFFAYAPPAIRSPRRLATELARRGRMLRDGLEAIIRAEAPEGPLRNLLDFYKRTLMDDLDEAGFADTFAQTMVYGMFLGWLRSPTGEFTRRSAAEAVPPSVPFLRSAIRLLLAEDLLPPAVDRLLDDLVALLANTQVQFIRDEVAAGGLEHDLVVYFYEQFLDQYDAGEKMNRGVFYTPPELVRYLVEATDGVLRRDFALERGLAEDSVVLLDPAVGTGTFLLGAAERALETDRHRGSAAQRQLIRDHLLVDFYGFELLPAPYAIAHLKLTTYFRHAGYELAGNERAQIYLTNSLQPANTRVEQLVFLPVLRGIIEEGRAASQVKDAVPVLVITGNPPYDRTSHNANPVSDAQIADFYVLDGERIPDRNTAPLRDDYLRFMRWAVAKLLENEDSPGHGVLAFVTNRAFVERFMHRAVRRFLLEKFDEIWVFDLHGDQREWFRDRVDEKVFKNVQAGIALTVFVKRPALTDPAADNDTGTQLARLWYREAFGTREDKLAACRTARIDDEHWATLEPRSPMWLFVPYEVPAEYERWPSIADVFPRKVIGVQTHRDKLVVGFTQEELRHQIEEFIDSTTPDARWIERGIVSGERASRAWLAQTRPLLAINPPDRYIRWTFRPFDRRWLVFDNRLIDRARTQESPHLLRREDNLALVFSNGSLTDGPYALVSRGPVPAAALSWRTFGQAYFAPVLVEHTVLDSSEWKPNVPDGLLDRLASHGIEVDAFGLAEYVYAVLNAPYYRRTYAHGLRYLFGRVPFARDPETFTSLRGLGRRLVALHLLEAEDLDSSGPALDGDDRCLIGQPTYLAEERTVLLGPSLRAHPVAPEVWEYQQGSYPVLRSYLSDRAGRRLSAEEFEDFRLSVAAITETMGLLSSLDNLVASASAEAFTADQLGLAELLLDADLVDDGA